MSEWQTIDSAPRDTVLLLARPPYLGTSSKVATGRWYDEGAVPGFYSDNVGKDDISATDRPATHWMHLPDAPQ